MGHHRDYDHKRFDTTGVSDNTTQTQLVGGALKASKIGRAHV